MLAAWLKLFVMCSRLAQFSEHPMRWPLLQTERSVRHPTERRKSVRWNLLLRRAQQ